MQPVAVGPQYRMPKPKSSEPAMASIRLLKEGLMKQRFLTETVFGDNDKAQFVLAQLKDLARDALLHHHNVFAVVLAGSRTDGIFTDASDADLWVISDRAIYRIPTFFERKMAILYPTQWSGELSLDFRYQQAYGQIGLDIGTNFTYLAFAKCRRFVLAAREEYYLRMEAILKRLDKLQFEFAADDFDYKALHVHVLGSHPHEPNLTNHFTSKVAARAGIYYYQVTDAFNDPAYFAARLSLGIRNKEHELMRLDEEAHALGNYLLSA